VIAALSARLPRRALLVALMAAFLVGNAASALAPGFATLSAARFVSGLPHGAFFGVASLVAASLVSPRRRGRAGSSVLLGLSVALVVGVPLATWLGQQLGWRAAYWLVVALVALTSPWKPALFVGVFLVSVAASCLAICLQLRLMETAGEAQMLGAALNHSALNLANALGAWLGGLVITAGLGYRAPSVVGTGLAAAGLVPLAVSAVLRRRWHQAAAASRPAEALAEAA
jgi:DHA1 family inner membrane transport protein